MSFEDISKRIKEFDVNENNIDSSINDIIVLCSRGEGKKKILDDYFGSIKNFRKRLKQ